LGSQIEFRELTRYLLADITRAKNLLIDVDCADVIEIFKAKNINIPVKAINENILVLNYKHHIALGVRVNDIITYVTSFES
jgi:3-deoxy-D-arabino-heptulosonate 7-phosphate (DAHP) synthase class II